MLTDHKPGEWFKAKASGQGGNCVQATWTSAARCPGGDCVQVKQDTQYTSLDGQPLVCVRDSKLGDESEILRFTFPEWRAFIASVKAGEFDLPRE